MLLASALLLFAGVALSEAKVYSQTLTVDDTNNDHGKIVNGLQPRPNAYPFLVSLIITFGRDSYQCGGSLLNSKYILTAAHCVVDDDGRKVTRIKILLGAHNLDQSEPKRIVRYADQFWTADYDSETSANDIAVIRMSESVTFTDAIKPTCLASPGSDHVSQYATVAGWGAIGTDMPSSDVLLHIQVPILPDRTCSRKYGRDYDDDVMMCAGYTDGSKDSCQGDSGGPLFIRNGNGFTTVGVVSFGMECAKPQYPGVYAEVQHFTDWIRQRSADGGNVCVN